MKKNTQLLLIMALAVIIGIAACQKSVNKSSDPATNLLHTRVMDVTNDLVLFTSMDDEDFAMATEQGDYAEFGGDAGTKCHTVTYDPSKDVYPHTKTLDFTGCPTKSGKIIITYYDPKLSAEGLYSVQTFDNYYEHGYHVEGRVQLNKIKNESGQTVWLRLTQKVITDADGNFKDWNGTEQHTLVDYNGEPAFDMTGHGEGSETVNGIVAKSFIVDLDPNNHPIRPIACVNRVQGGVIIGIHIPQGDPSDIDEYLDYGAGACDDEATIAINGDAPVAVSLPLRFWPLQQ